MPSLDAPHTHEHAVEPLIRTITPVDAHIARAVQQRLDEKTKPRGSLGRLEALACQLGAILRSDCPSVDGKAICVMAADHGVAREGVSAYPQEVTAQMVQNFAAGGAAINALAGLAGARLIVVDVGVLPGPTPMPVDGKAQLRRWAIAPGTANFLREPAMSDAQVRRAIALGAALAVELADAGVTVIGLGEMGIGNTTAASALVAALTGVPVERVTGRGTGLDERAHAHKVDVIRRALERHAPALAQPHSALRAVGGLELAALVGLVLGAAARRLVVVMDGFITGAAALAAVRMAPAVAGYLVAAHRSVEPGHAVVLETLGSRPLLDLELRLGEGSGAALAMPLLDAAARILRDMASFTSAGVSERRA